MDSCRKAVFFGVPHPIIRDFFEYISAIVAAGGPEHDPIECELVTIDRGGTVASDAGIYLRASATDALEFAVLGHPSAVPGLSLACALVARLESLWGHLPSLSLEVALEEELHTALFLAEHLRITLGQPALAAGRAYFNKLRNSSSIFGHPFRFLASVETGGAEDALRLKLDQTYVTAIGGNGVNVLVDGWSRPERWGVWSVGHSASIRLMPPHVPLVLTCICWPLRADLCLSVVANRTILPFTSSHEGRQTILSIPLYMIPEGDENRSTYVQFLIRNPKSPKELGINEDGRLLGIGLMNFTLTEFSGLATSALPANATLESCLIEAGFSWKRVERAVATRPLGDVAHLTDELASELVNGRSIRSVLIVGPDSLPAAAALGRALPSTTLIACALTDGAPIPDGGTVGVPLPADASDENPGILVGRIFGETQARTSFLRQFDLVHFQMMEGVRDFPELLRRLFSTVADQGLLSGCERSRDAVVKLLAESIPLSADWRIMFALKDDHWRAFPTADGAF
jgi:hypothetical protein